MRTGGITGPRIDPGQLWGCLGTSRRAYPQEWGYSSWKDVRKVTRTTPLLDNGCLPTRTATTSVPAAIAGTRGDRTVRVAWKPPAAGASTVDGTSSPPSCRGPSISAWHPATYRTVPAGQFATTFRELDNGRLFRFRVLAHNPAGNSAWTSSIQATPATAPLAPATDRQLTTGTSYLRFGWSNGTAQGAPITSYTAGIRQKTVTGWTAWTFVTTAADVRTYRWDGLRRNTTYQVTVRANSGAGSSPWGVFRALTTLR